MNDADLRKEYAEAGVDLPEIAEEQTTTPETKPEEAPTTPEKSQEAPDAETEVKDENPNPDAPQAPSQPRKRSIYQDYKEVKSDLKTEKEMREQAERERDELRTKLEALDGAKTPEERKEAQDDLDAFAKEINADPNALRRLRDIFFKDAPKADADESLRTQLEAFAEWQKQNAPILEAQQFEREYQAALPAIKEIFPNANDAEMQAIRSEIDKLAHSTDYHDKSLDYVAFMNRKTLGALISPRKAGIERKGRADATDVTFDFDPNADFSKMTPEQQKKWEDEYNRMMKSDGLIEDGQGRKFII